MFSRQLVALAATLSTASATYQGFNYGSGLDYSSEFALAKSLVGTSGAFTSARLYTMIEEGSTNTPTSAIPAAIANDVTLLLGLWASGGQADLSDEIAALTAAISTYGTAFTSRVAAISVGSEDLYRISPTGIINKSGVGAEPDTIVDYISQVRSAIAGTSLSGALVGHVDTWTAWVNGSNDAVIDACDFIGMDAYPYFQNTQVNAISDAYDLFYSAYDQTLAATSGKPVWVTETGWPASGPSQNLAVPSVANAKTYWDQVACMLLGSTNTYWYTLDDAGASPSFGVTDGSSTPLYDLSCSASSSSSSSSASSTSSSVSSAATSASASTTPTSSSATATSSAASSASASSTSAIASSASASSVSASSASASSASVSSSVAVAQTSVPVSTSAVASEAGSPADTTSASADSSAASFASASSSAYASAVASASSAVSAASAAATETTASAAGSASVAAASSAASAASSEIASSSAIATSTLATETASGTSTGSATLASYTGAASTVQSTGGFVAALFAVLMFL